MANIEAIYIAPKNKEEMLSVKTVEAVSHSGLKGDRYYCPQQSLPHAQQQYRKEDLSLIAAEEIEAFNAATGLALPFGDFRRNLVTRGIDLNAYVGKRMRIGDCIVMGIELCEPCRTLAKQLTPLVFPHLVHKAGLRCAILQSGHITVNAQIDEYHA